MHRRVKGAEWVGCDVVSQVATWLHVTGAGLGGDGIVLKDGVLELRACRACGGACNLS